MEVNLFALLIWKQIVVDQTYYYLLIYQFNLKIRSHFLTHALLLIFIDLFVLNQDIAFHYASKLK
jgi:hypothetical protein